MKTPGIRNPRSDNTAPTVPGNLTAGTTTQTTVPLSWFPSSDTFGVAGYQIWRNGSPIGTSPITSFTDTGRTPNTSYSYNVSAYDDAGNMSGLSNTVVATTQPSVANGPPVWQTIAQQELTVGQNYNLNLGPLVTDPEGQAVSITKTTGTLPAGVTFNTTTKTVSGVPTAFSTPSVTFRASDGTAFADKTIVFNCLNADSTPPTVPTGLAGTGVSRTQINLSWNASTEATVANARQGTLAGYKLYRNGALRATLVGSVLTYQDMGLAALTGYSYQVASYDSNGNESAKSTAVPISTLANTPPRLTSSTTLPALIYPVTSPQTYQMGVTDDDGDVVDVTRTGGTAPAGVTVSSTGLISFPAGHAQGTFTISGDLDDHFGDTAASNWEARSVGPGVIARHRMANESELLVSYIAPTNADQGQAITIGLHPPIICPHVGVEPNGKTYFEETLIGARLSASVVSAASAPIRPLTQHVYPTGQLNNVTIEDGKYYAELQIPATSQAGVASSTLGFVAVQSVYKVTSIADPTKFWFFDADVNTGARPRGPIANADGSYTLPVRGGKSMPALYPLSGTVTGIKVEHCVLGNLSNPVQTIVIDENIPLAGKPVPGGPNTSWWPNPTKPAWDPAQPSVIPTDAYTVVMQYEHTTDRIYLWKDRVTVYAASYDPETLKTTLVIRRAAIQASDAAGRIEDDWVGRGFPCDFPPAGALSGSTPNDCLIGRDNKGGWRRSLAPLPAGDNGLTEDDPAAQGMPDPADRVRLRKLINPATGIKYTSYRTGYYGHRHYHNIWNDSNPYSATSVPKGSNSLPSNGASPYNGDHLYFAVSIKYSGTWAFTDTTSKTFFFDSFEREANSQIVGNAPSMSSPRWKWYHNKGSDLNSDLSDLVTGSYNPGSGLAADGGWEDTCIVGSLSTPGKCWEPPLDEYFGVLFDFKAGHDNDMSYAHDNGSVLTAVISDNHTSAMTIQCTHQPLLPTMTWHMDGTGGYFATDTAEEGNPQVGVNADGNPIGLDPTQSTYFDNWNLQIGPAGTGAYGEFKIAAHRRVDATTSEYDLVKKSPSSVWPAESPVPGPTKTIRIQWSSDTAACAKYKDTYIKLYKREIGDPLEWVPVVILDNFPIAWRKGAAYPANGDSNPPGWSEFQPTAYANVDDNNLPPDLTRFIRMTDFIWSKLTIPPPNDQDLT